MAGWLPEGFQVDETRMERSVLAVSGRIVRRKARVRLTKQFVTGTLAMALVAGGVFLLRPGHVVAPVDPPRIARLDPPRVPDPVIPSTPRITEVEAPTRRGGVSFVGAAHRGRQREGAVALPYENRGDGAAPVRKDRGGPLALPVTLAKVDDSVAVRWTGNPGDEFEVYRCESPTFETCSLAGRVQGTSWVDSGLDGPGASGTITYYKVVPRVGA
jgi:hypothetical protein